MSTHSNEPIGEAQRDELRKLGYDRTDMSPFGVTMVIVYFLVSTAVFILIAFYIYRFMANHLEAQREAESKPKVSARRLPDPPHPLLQSNVTAHTDIKDLRDREHRILNSYGWVDRSIDIAHIPVERAIAVMAEQGVPAQPFGSSATPGGRP